MAESLGLATLSFRAGAKAGDPQLVLDVPTVTILVGPNNSGKSLALREIERWCWNENATWAVVADIAPSFPRSEEEALQLIKALETDPPDGRGTDEDHVWIGLPTFREGTSVIHEQVSLASIRKAVSGRNVSTLRHVLTRCYTVRLDGRTRFTLSDPKATGDLQRLAQNHLWSLFQDDEARDKVRAATASAFGSHFVVDPTAMTQFRVRMAPRAPHSKQEEQALDAGARAFHRNAPLIQQLSDGVQAFTGLVSAVMSCPHSIILIDEPEAFLHPPLARRLGQNLAKIASSRGASLVVATHSAEFLMGCVEATADIAIVRLTYEAPVATARAVSPRDLKQLVQEPLLRSVTALRGLFHRGAVVCEADRDRAFYEEMNYRLSAGSRGIEDVVFLNAQNWQTIPRIVGPLRRLGIPAAAIMDMDVLAEPTGWDAVLAMLSLDVAESGRVHELKVQVEAGMRDVLATPEGKANWKAGGMGATPPAVRPSISELCEMFAYHGLFIVDVGEVECWLSSLGVVPKPKNSWLTRLFDRLGANPTESGYVSPGTGDVWAFIEAIGRWISNPNRDGMA